VGARPVLTLAAALVLSSVVAPAGGEEHPVRVVTEHLPPFSYRGEEGVRGASTAVVRAVMAEAGVAYAIEILPWRRALDAALHEPNTFIYSVARTGDRESSLAWLGKICDRRLGLYCLKERRDLLDRPLSELGHCTIAVIQGDASIEVLRELGFGGSNFHILRDAEADLASVHVLEGRSDFFVSNPDRMEYGLRGTPLEGRFAQHSIIWEGDGYYLAANPASDPALLARVGRAFASLSARGELERVFTAALAESMGR
jgi:polar amino acid transport system substrate-binding protein